jgi:hypothetical protein
VRTGKDSALDHTGHVTPNGVTPNGVKPSGRAGAVRPAGTGLIIVLSRPIFVLALLVGRAKLLKGAAVRGE